MHAFIHEYLNYQDILGYKNHVAYILWIHILTISKYVDFYHLKHDDVIKWKNFPRYWPFVREFPTQRPVTRSFDVYFDLRPNKRLSKSIIAPIMTSS